MLFSFCKRILVLVLLFTLFMSCNIAGLQIYEAIKFAEIGQNKTPDLFPVLVTWRENQQLMAHTPYFKDLASFTADKKEISFLIPADQEAEIRRLVKQNTRVGKEPGSSKPTELWSAGFTIKNSLPDGAQTIAVSATTDSDRKNVGIYKATSTGFTPLKHLMYFGPGVVMAMLPVSALLTAVIYALVKLWLSRKPAA